MKVFLMRLYCFLFNRSQSYFWSDRWQAMEKEVDEDIQSGRFEAFDSAEDLVRQLK